MPVRGMAGNGPAARRTPDFAAIQKDITALQTHRRARERTGAFFVEGVRNFVQAVDAGFRIERILFSERLLISPVARKLVRRSRRAGIPALTLTPEEFRQLSGARRAAGVAAVVRQRWTGLQEISPAQGLCWIVLETVRSPGNLGTLIRSSQAAGGAGFILVGNSVDPFSPAVIRSAMGAIYHQTFVRTDWRALHRWKDSRGCAVIGATPDAAADLHAFAFPQAPLLVLGEERGGLTAPQRKFCSTFVRIPMQPGTDSLNLGVAGSLMMYEVHRSRGRSGAIADGREKPERRKNQSQI